MSVTINSKDYATLLRVYEEAKQPIFVQGSFGIGKSAIPRQVFSEVAAERKLKFVEWSDCTNEEKLECIDKPSEFYVFFDARTSQMDTTSLQGIPNMNKTDLLENIPYSWAVYFTQKDANGVIFFDELNLAAPIVQSITYSAIHDRVISDRRLGDNVYVFAAGNRAQDKGHTYEMAQPLRDRFAEMELEVDAQVWIEWARSQRINPHLISFIDWKKGMLNKVDEDIALKPSTPRGVERASKMISNYDLGSSKDSVIIHQLVSMSVGQAFAAEFLAYTKAYSRLNWKTIFENPESVGEMTDISMQYAVAGGLIDLFTKSDKETPAKKKELFNNLMNVTLHPRGLKKGLKVHVLMSMKQADPTVFKNVIKETGRGKEIAQSIGKFIAG